MIILLVELLIPSIALWDLFNSFTVIKWPCIIRNPNPLRYGQQPTSEQLAIGESLRAAFRSSAAALAVVEDVKARAGAAHAQLVVAFSKEMADADGEMLAEYVVMDATEPEVLERELDMEAAAEIDERQLEY